MTGRWSSRGRGSDAEVETPAAWLFEFRDGRVYKSRAFRDADEALSDRREPPTS